MAKSRFGIQPADIGQLSLFSDAPDVEILGTLETESRDDRNQHTDATRTPDPRTLESLPTGHGPEVDPAKPTPAGDLRGPGVDGEPPLRFDGGSEDGLPTGLGDRDEGMGIPPGRGGSAPTVVRSSEPRPVSTLARDLRITCSNAIGEGSPKQKAQANLAAIRTLKAIEAEARQATPEEKAVLVKYTGWGALSNLFAPYPPYESRAVADELKAALSDEEYASARASTPNAHYTSSEVVQAMWQAMERFGLQAGAHILEPSMGVGHFFGMMPEGLHSDTKRTGVELDSVTARIASKLYPDSNVHAKALEETQLPGNFFDAVIGNIPFGNYPVFDPAYRRSPHLTRAIHDYFLAKCLGVVRPGGVVALITSHYTMDKKDSAVRHHLADGSVLLGALRLPNTTFRANAGTDVTTDILFLQKKPSPQREHEETWADLGQIESSDGPLQINEYFIRHPEMMLGRMANDTGRYGTPTAFLEGDFEPQALTGAISRLPTGVYSEAQRADR